MLLSNIDPKKIFFIIGVGRSGTTILQELLNTFPKFCNQQESEINGHGSGSCWTLVRRSNDFIDLEKFIEQNFTEEFFVEKTPDSIMCLPQLSQKYPDANYLFIERNPFDIILSQLNLFYGNLIDNAKKYHLDNLVISNDDVLLPPEQYWAKLNLIQIKLQQQYKNKFKNSLTIRYESLVENLEEQITKIGNHFNLKPNLEKAISVLKRPSTSSKNNRYHIKTIKDPISIEMIVNSCKIWDYSLSGIISLEKNLNIKTNYENHMLQNINNLQKIISEKDSLINQLVQDIELLQNRNVSNTNLLNQYASKINNLVKEIETLHNINLHHQKILKQKNHEIDKLKKI